MRNDVQVLTAGQAADWAKFCPGVQPGQPLATKLNPKLAAPT
jgi:hypothetical protein